MRIAIVTDIHEDIVSLRQALRKIDRLSIDKVVCLGDISGFSVPHYEHHNTRSAHECLKLLRKNCDLFVLGNHDLHAIKRIPHYSPNFEYPDNWYELNYFEKEETANGQLWIYEENELPPLYSRDDIRFLSKQNEIEVFEINGLSILFSHFAYPNLTGSEREFYFIPEDFTMHFEFMTRKKCNIGIIGHAHPAGLLYFTPTLTINKGFRKRSIPDDQVSIVAPSISQSGKKNGFLIIDSKKYEVEAVRI